MTLVHGWNPFHQRFILAYRSTSIHDSFPASFREFFGVFHIVANESFSVVMGKLTYVDLVASEKHFEGTFNLYIFVVLVC